MTRIETVAAVVALAGPEEAQHQNQRHGKGQELRRGQHALHERPGASHRGGRALLRCKARLAGLDVVWHLLKRLHAAVPPCFLTQD